MPTVLWIEDDYDRIGGLVKKLIENHNFNFTVIKDYASYLDLENKYKYDLHIVDLIIPQEKYHKIVSNEDYIDYPGIKIVEDLSHNEHVNTILVYSVVSQLEIVERLQRLPKVTDVVQKPTAMFPSDFTELVLELIGKHR
jgi:DNA-binding response OmpR family regulator